MGKIINTKKINKNIIILVFSCDVIENNDHLWYNINVLRGVFMPFVILGTISTIDIIIYVFIGVFCIIGLFKGFVKLVFSLVKGIVSFIAAYFLTKPLCSLLEDGSLGTKINSKILSFITEKAPSTNVEIDLNNYSDQINTAVEEAGVPGFIGNYIGDWLNISDKHSGMTLGSVLSEALTHVCVTILSFVILFIIVSIVLFILFKIFKSIVDKGGLKAVDATLGFITNGVIAFFTVCFVLLILNTVSVIIPAVDTWIKSLIYIEGMEEGAFSIAKVLYENNPLRVILENLFNI